MKHLLLSFDIQPVGYTLQADNWITALLLLCFFLTACLFPLYRNYLWGEFKGLLFHKDRSNLFEAQNRPTFLPAVWFLIQTALLCGLYLFCCLHLFGTDSVQIFSPLLCLVLLMGSCLLFLMLKFALYYLIGGIFFDRELVLRWLRSYSTLLHCTGFLLFFFLLLLIYFNLSPWHVLIGGAVLWILVKILIMYKWIKLFLSEKYGLFPLIAYFCALEIIPYLIIGQGIIDIYRMY